MQAEENESSKLEIQSSTRQVKARSPESRKFFLEGVSQNLK